MVKRSRLQSGESPSRRIWRTMVRPTAPSIPRPWRRRPRGRARAGPGCCPEAASWRSTTICVAMPAWSVPGCHSTASPRMRWNRISVSWMVWSSAWPMCRLPVTLGGGSTMQKGEARFVGPGREAAARFPLGVDAGFDLGGPVGLVEHTGEGCPSVIATPGASGSALSRRKRPERQGDGRRSSALLQAPAADGAVDEGVVGDLASSRRG